LDLGRYGPAALPRGDVTGQYIDAYGKCRALIFGAAAGASVKVYISPLAPFSGIPIISENVDTAVATLAVVTKWATKNAFEIVQQDVVPGTTELVGLVVRIPGIMYAYAPIKTTPKLLPNVPHGTNLNIFKSMSGDLIKLTRQHKKIADFLMQYTLYAFSIWYKNADHPEPEIQSSAMKFVQIKHEINNLVDQFFGAGTGGANSKASGITIQPDYTYNLDNVPREFTMNGIFFNSGKLIINSADIAEKLHAYLRFMVNKNRTPVLEYSARVYLDNYYTFSEDFRAWPAQNVFIGNLAIGNWISTFRTEIANYVHTVAHGGVREPQFFAHWAINDGQPCILQNVVDGTLQNAVHVAQTFARDGYNVGFEAHGADAGIDGEYTVYELVNGQLVRDGTARASVWKFTEQYYAALLI